MPVENLLGTLKAKLGGKVVETHAFRGDDTAVVAPEAWQETASLLKNELGFDFLLDPVVDLRFDAIFDFRLDLLFHFLRDVVFDLLFDLF